MRLAPLLILVAACGGKKDSTESTGSGGATVQTGKPFAGPMAVTFGDCAGSTVAFVSGPKPLPFTPEQAAGDWTTADAVAAANGSDDPPPPDDEGGTGTAMAIDEGKMGQKDADAKKARQQAIDAARNAGILGSRALDQGGAFGSLNSAGGGAFDDTNIYGGLLGNEAGEMNGGFGFGRSGFGPGGGGTGWGTIGTGRYGSMPSSGYGVGGTRGGMRGRTAAVPTISIGTPNAQGDLDKAIIRRYIKRNIQKITYCYEKELLAKPNIEGTINVQFFITPNGTVSSASAHGVDKNVAACVASVIKGIEFPKPKGGGGVQVNYPFTFRKAGDDTTATAKAPPVTPPPVAPPDAGVIQDTAIPDAAPAAAPKATARSLFRAPDHAVDASQYSPGEHNPLRAQHDALESCFRAESKHFGVAVVELAYDPSGNVTAATANGVEPSVATCIAAAAKKTKRISASGAGERCSVAFGDMPTTAMSNVEITATDVKIDGTKAGAADAIAKQDVARIPELAELLDSKRTPLLAATGPVVAIHGPHVVRPTDDASTTTVVRVLSTILSTGDDVVFATKRGTDWKLMRQMSFPIVPVPYGTGGMWAPIKGTGSGMMGDDERVVLSLLVTKERVWVGLSRVNEFQEIPRDQNLATKLQEVLSAHKSSAFFTDRRDVEVAGDPDTKWADIVMLIDATEKSGFVEWRFTDVGGLAAAPTL